MKKLFKLVVLTLVLSLLVCACGTKTPAGGVAQGEKIKVRMAHTGTELTMAHGAFEEIKRYMEEASGGVFEVTIYPNGQLGNDAQLVEAVQEGDVELMFTNTGNLISFVPELGVYAAPFVFPNNETAYKVLDGEFGKEMLDIVSEKGGIAALGYLEAVAYRQLSSNRAVNKLEDLKGLKIRVMTNPIQIAIWETLGAQPTAISFAELYTALQQGTVDAQENPLELFINQRFYEVQKNVTLTNHVFTTGMFVANPDWFDSLDENLQNIIREATERGVSYQREKAAQDFDNYLSQLKEANIEIIELSEEESARWREKAAPVYDIIAKDIGQDLLNRLFKAVEEAK